MSKNNKQDHPILYPLDRDLNRKWFVQYPNPHGGKPLKKYGNLNNLPTIDQRLIEAQQIIDACYQEIKPLNQVNGKLVNLLQQVVEFRMHGKKVKTVYGYTSKLKVFLQWYRQLPDQRITEYSGRQFLMWLTATENLSNITINGYRRHLKSFFAELKNMGEITINPFDATKKLPEKVSTKTWFRPEQQQLLFKWMEADLQLCVACMVQFYCFIRPGDEMQGLKIIDIIDRETPKWRFKVNSDISKTRRFRFVPIPEVLKIKLQQYINNAPDHYYLFGKHHAPSNERIGRNDLYNRHKQLLDGLDFPKGYTFYSWKNTGAVMMYKNGIKMKYISLLMGHSSIEITDTYFKSLGIDDVMDEVTMNYPTIGI